MKILKFLGTLLALQLVLPYQLLAHPVSPGSGSGNLPHSGTANAGSGAAAFNSPINLNLSSTVKSLALGSLISAPSVSINIGGVMTTLTSSSMVTAAEALAASEVAGGHRQTLNLSASGNASSGKVFLGNSLAQAITGLVVPAGVKLFDNANSVSTLNLSGDLTNAGRFIVFATPGSTASISAFDITNMAGGVISANGLNLNLTALNNMTNAGTISSGGDLSLSAGGTLSNSGTVQAANNVNLFSTAGNMVNSGLIAATTGNINLATLAANQLNMNNSGGTLQALNGAINLRDMSYTGNADTNVNGGNLLSQALNVYSGQGGMADISVNQITGLVNEYGNGSHVTVANGTLNLGTIDLTGDPTFYNDNGSIDITSQITAGEDLAIVASDNIVATTSTAQITTGGNNLLMIAGATITACGTCTPSTSLPGGTPVPSGQAISVNLTTPSSTGGNIDLSTSQAGEGAGSIIDTSNTGGAGGNVTLVALAHGAGTGQVNLQYSPTTNSINTSGNTSSNGGNVTVYAGNNDGSAVNGITVGNVTSGGGAIALATTQASGNLTLNDHGQIVAGAISAGTLTQANISTGALSSGPGSVQIQSGYDATIGGSVTTTGGAVSVTAVDSITAGVITTGGGSLLMLAGEFGTNGDITINNEIGTSSTTGNGGNVWLISLGSLDGNITTQGITTTSSASGGNGGMVTASSSYGTISLGNITTTATDASGGNGGDVLLTAYFGASVNNIDTSTANASSNAGQVWVDLYTSSWSFTTITQNQAGVQEANPVVLLNQPPLGIGSGTSSIVFTPDYSPLGVTVQAGNISGFSPGGYFDIVDTSGASDIQLSIGGSHNIDSGLVIPLISVAQITLGNNSGSLVEMPTSTNAIPAVAFFGQQGMTIGTVANPVSLTTNGQGVFYLGSVGNIGGNVSINSSATQEVQIANVVSNNGFSFTNNGTIDVGAGLVGSLGALTLVSNVATTGSVNVMSGANLASSSVTLQADNLTINGPVTAVAGTVQLESFSTAITIGTAGSGLVITPAQLANITTGTLIVGRPSDTFGLTVNGDTSVANNLTLQDGVSVTIAGSTTVTSGLVFTANLGSGATFTNSGTVQSSLVSGTGILVEDTTSGDAISVDGTGNLTTSGANVEFLTSSNNNSSITFGPTLGLNQTVSMSGGALQINTPTLIVTSANSPAIMSVDGTNSSTIAVTGAGNSTLTFTNDGSAAELELNGGAVTAKANNITVTTSTTLSTDTTITVNLAAGDTFTNNGLVETLDNTGINSVTVQGSGGLVLAGSGSITTGATDSATIQDATSITLNNGLTINYSGNQLEIVTPLVIGQNSGTANINSTGYILMGNSSGSLTIEPATAVGTTTINFGAGIETTVQAFGDISVNKGVSISSSSYIDFSPSLTGGTFTNNGSISTTSSGIEISGSGGASGLLIAGTTGQFSPFTGNGVLVDDATSITFVNGLNWTVTSGTGITFDTPIIIGQNSGTATVTATGGTVELTNSTPGDLTLEPVTAGQTTNFAFNGGAVQTDSNNLSINSAVNLASNALITMNVHNGGTFTDAGSVSSTASLTPAVAVQADNNRTLNVDMVGTGSITATAGGIEFNPTVTGADIDINANPGVGTISSFSNTNFNGGDGQGNVNVNVKALSGTGVVVASGESVSILVASGPLNVNTVNASAGTTVSLTASTGDINITIGGMVEAGTSLTTNSNNLTIMELASTQSGTTSTFNVGSTDTFTNNGSIGSSLTGPATVITVQTTGSMFLAGTTGSYTMSSGNTALFSAPTSLTLENGLSQSSTNGSFALQTPTVIGQDTGTETFSSTNGSISLSSAGALLTIKPITIGQTTTINLNAPTVSTTSQGLTIASNATINSTGRITFNVTGGGSVTENGVVSSSATLNAIAFQADPTQNFTLTFGAGASLTATNGSVVFNPTAAESVSVLGGPANGTINAANSINFDGGATGVTSVNVNSIGGAGAVTASGSSVSVQVAAGTLTVNGVTVPASGGAITLENNAATNGNVVLQQGLTSNGGAIQITASGNISAPTFAINASSASTNGGSITMTAGGNLLTGNITSNGGTTSGTGDGGIIQLTSNSASTFDIGPSAFTNGVNSTITANGGTTSGNGGQVTITNNGAGGITLEGVGAISVNATTSGNGGLLDFQAPTSSFTVSAGTSVSLNGAGTAGNGGTFTINAETATLAGATTINAIGSGSGKGGTVSITLSGATSNINVDGTQFVINAYADQSAGGTGSGGSITLVAGQNITANSSDFFVNPSPDGNGNGGTLIFTAGKDLLVTGGSVSVDAAGTGTDGTIQFTSNDAANAFIIGPSATVNGVAGTLYANATSGGSITVKNTAASGAVTVNGNAILSSATATVTVGTGGTVTIDSQVEAGTTATVNLAGGALVMGASSTLQGAGGVNVNGISALTLDNNAVIETTTSAADTFDSASGALQITVNSLAANHAEIVTDGGPINFNNITNLTISGASGNELLFTTFNGSGPVTFNTTNTTIGATGNNVEVAADSPLVFNANNGTFTNNGVVLTLSSSEPGVTVASTGTLTLAGTQGSFSAGASNRFIAPTSISFVNGTDYTINGGTAELITPQVFVGATGDTGAVTAEFNMTTASGAFVQGAVASPFGSVEFSKLAAATSGTLEFVGSGGVQVKGNSASIDANVTVEGNNSVSVTLNNAGTFTNNGTLAGTGSTSDVTVSINGAGTGTMANTGTISSDGTGAGTIVLENTNASGTLVITGNGGIFSQTNGTAGTTEFLASGTLNFDNGMSQSVNGNGTVLIQAPIIETGNAAGPAVQSSLLNAGSTSQVDIQSNGSQTGTIEFSKFASATTSATLTIDANNVAPTANTLQVDSGVVLSTPSFFNAAINANGTFSNAGMVTVGLGGTIQAIFAGGSGTNGSIINTGTFSSGSGGGEAIAFFNNTGGNLTLSGSGGTFTMTNGAAVNPAVEFAPQFGTMIFANGTSQSVTGGGVVYVISPDIRVGSNVAGAQTATLTTNGSFILEANGSQTGTLTFDQFPNQTATTLSLQGAAVTMQANNIDVTPNTSASLTVTTNKAMTLDVNAGGTLANNGLLASTLTSPATSITVQGGGGITLSGSGQFNPGTGNTIAFNDNTSITFANAANQQVLNGATIVVTTQTLNLGTSTSTSPVLQATGASAITLTSPANTNLTINGADDSSSFIGTNLGSISVTPGTSGYSVTFGNENGVSTNIAYINLNTDNSPAGVTITTASPGSTTINSNSNLVSDSGVTVHGSFNINGSFEPSGPIIMCNIDLGPGAFISTLGNLDIQCPASPADLQISMADGAYLQSVNGSIVLNYETAGTITVTATGPNGTSSMLAPNGSVTFNGGATGSVSATAGQIQGTVTGTGTSFGITSTDASTALTTGTITSTLGTASLQANGNISITGTIQGPIVSVQATGSNGGITVGGNVTATNSAALTAYGSGSILNATTPLNAVSGTSVTLATTNGSGGSGTGSIGAASGTGSIQTAAQVTGFLTATTAGTGSVYISQNGSTQLGVSTAGNTETFQVVTTNGGSLAINGGVTATGGTINLTVDPTTNANISEVFGTLNVGSAGTINFKAGGEIGSNPTLGGARILTSAGTLTAVAGGSAFLSDNVSLALGVSSAGAGQTFDLVTSPGSNGSITVDGGVTTGLLASPTGTVNLNANGTGAIIQETGVIATGSLNLTSAAGAIGVNSLGAEDDIQTTASGLTANTTGNAYVTDDPTTTGGTVTVGASSANILKITTTFSGASTGSTIAFTTSTLNAAVSMTLSAGGTGDITETTGQITTPILTLRSGSGYIGTVGNPILINSSTLSVNDTTENETGDVNINDTPNGGTVSLGASSYGDNFNLTTLANGSINMAGFTLTGGTSAKLIANGSGNIEQTAGGLIATPTLRLESTSGSIGLISGSFVALQINASTLYVNDTTTNVTGNVNIVDAPTGGTVTFGASSYGNNFNLSTTSGSNGTIDIAATTLTGNTSVNLTAGGSGDIEQTNSGMITTPTLHLESTTGVIGYVNGSFVILQTNASTLYVNDTTANVTGDVNIADNPTGGTVTLGASSYGNNFHLSTLANGNFDIAGFTLTGGTSVVLSANGSGNIEQTAGGKIATPTLYLNSTTGIVGPTSGSFVALQINASTLYVNNVTSNVTGDVNIVDTPTGGEVAFGANSYGNNFNLSTLSNGSINIDGTTLTGATTVTLSANGSGNIDDTVGTGLVSTPTVYLESMTGQIGGPTNTLNINASTLYANDVTANVTGNLHLHDQPTGGMVTLGANAYGKLFALTTYGITDIAGFTLTGSQQVDLLNQSGATNNIEQTAGGLISTPILEANSYGGVVGPISGSFVAIETNASSLQVNNLSANVVGDVNIIDTPTGGTVAFTANSYGNNFNLTTLSNGSINVSSFTLTGGTTVKLIANGSGAIEQIAGGKIATPTLYLESTTGTIGSLTSPYVALQINATTLYVNDETSNVTGDVNIVDTLPTNNGTVTFGASSFGNNFNLTTAASTNGNINIAATTLTGATTVKLVAGGSGNIEQTTGGSIATPTLYLESTTGVVGPTSGGFAELQIDASTLYVNDETSNVTGDVNIVDTPTGVANTVTFGASSYGNNFNLSTLSNGSINIAATTLTGNTTVILTANGSGNIEQIAGGSISTPTLYLESTTGVVGPKTSPYVALEINASTLYVNNLTSNVTGDVNIIDAPTGGTVTFGASSYGNNFNLSTTATSNGNINISTTTLTGETSVTLTAGGSGNIEQATGGSIATPTLHLESTTGVVGPLTAPYVALQIDASTLYVNDTTSNVTGDVNIVDTLPTNNGTVTFGASSYGNNFNLSTAASTNGNINIAATTLTGGTTVKLVAGGSGNIEQITDGSISTPTLYLESTTGVVGPTTSPYVALQINATTLYVNDETSNVTGDVNIFDTLPTNNGTVTFGASSYGNNFNLTTAASTNGNINIAATTLTAETTVKVVAGGSGNIEQTTGGSIATPTLYLESTTGVVGPTSGGYAELQINATTLYVNDATSNVTGDVNIEDTLPTDNGTVTFGASSYGNNFNLTTAASTNGNIDIAATTLTGHTSVDLTAGGSGNIEQIAGGSIATPTLYLESTTGTVGPTTSPYVALQINATTLYVNDETSNVTGDVNIVDTLPTSGGTVTFGASSYGNNFNLTTAASTNGNIDIAATTLTGNTSVNLTAGGSGNIEQTTGAIATPTLYLESTTGVVGPTTGGFAELEINATTLYVNDATSNITGNVNIEDTLPTNGGTVDFGASSYGNNFNLTTAASTNGNINLAATTLTGHTTVTLTAGGSGNIEQISGGSIVTPTLYLESTTGAVGLISGSFLALQVNASTLYVNDTTANVTGDVNIVDTPTGGTVTMGASSNGNNFNLSTLSNGNIALAGFTLTGGTSVTLGANGSGTITETTGSVSTAELIMSSTTGIIGTNGNNILTNAPTLQANTGGSVFVTDTPTGGTVSLLSSSAGAPIGDSFNLTTASGDNIAVDGTTAGGTVILTAAGTGNITQTAGSVGGTDVSLISNGGNIGAGTGSRVQTAVTGTLTVTTGLPGTVFINQTGDFTLGTSVAGDGFDLTSTASATIGTLSVADGSISVASGSVSGNLTVEPSVTISAGQGGITLQNMNAAGTLSIGNSATITANGTINILIGAAPVTPTTSATPANVKATATGGGAIYFGTTGTVTAIAPVNTVNAVGENVVFNTNPANPRQISLGGNVVINASSEPLITSLDLNPTTLAGYDNVQTIITLQHEGIVGGKLVLTGSGPSDAVVSGTLIVQPVNLAPMLTAEDIPTKVTLTMKGFTNNNNVIIDLTALSSQPEVFINGTEAFTGPKPTSNSTLTIDSVIATQPVLQIGSVSPAVVGKLTSDGTLTVDVQGDLSLLNGTIAAKNLTLATTSDTDSTGNIYLGGAVGMTGGTTTLNAFGTGTITNAAGKFSILGTTVSLTSGSGNIGTSSSAPLRTTTANITANTTGNIWLSNSGAVNLGASSAGGVFSLVSSGRITQTGVLSGSSVSLTSTAGVILNTNITANDEDGTITLNGGTGGVVSNGGLLSGYALDVLSTTGSIGSLNSPLNTNAQSITATVGTSSYVYIQDITSDPVTVNSSTAGYFNLSSMGNITTGNINKAARINLSTAVGGNGSITLTGNLGAAGGIVTLSTSGTGTINEAEGGIITGSQVYLTTGTAGIGTDEAPIVITALLLGVNTAGSAYVTNSNAVTLAPSTVAGTYMLNNAGTITISSAVAASTINFTTTANGSIRAGAALGQTGATIDLTAGGSGRISGNRITGDALDFTSGTGVINVSTTAADLTANTGGNASVTDSNTGALVINGTSSSGGVFSITTTGGGLEASAGITAGTSLTLSAGTGVLMLDAGQTLMANKGAVTLINRDLNNGSIYLDTGSTITAIGKSNGNVVLQIGTTVLQRNTNVPFNVTVDRSFSGQAYFGIYSILANTPNNTINVDTNKVTFSNYTQSANVGAITLNGDVTINADPTAPISYHANSSSNEEMVVDTGDDGDDAGADGNQLVDALQ